MVFGVAELVSYLSQGSTLEPGSLILTGTTKGVGFKRNPKVFLENGSDIRVSIEGIGTLVNRVRYEDW
jgi:2-keto-4-pentenoate hydratase/2-oxohepta-3-ene-1,7-dioic acid hydratase in catechol pathway